MAEDDDDDDDELLSVDHGRGKKDRFCAIEVLSLPQTVVSP